MVCVYPRSRKKMNLPIEKEKLDLLIVSRSESELITGTPHDEYLRSRQSLQNELLNRDIKQEPAETIDLNDSEYDEEYLDEDIGTEQIQGRGTNTNNSTESNRKTRTNPAQQQLLTEFMRKYAALSKGLPITLNTGETLQKNEAWDVLTNSLNAMGPPTRTNAQWRRAWTLVKFNKRKRQQSVEAKERESKKRLRLQTSSDSYTILSSLDDESSTSSKTQPPSDETGHFHSQILKKMDVVAEQQMKHNDQLKRLNRNVEKLIEVLSQKFS